MFCYQCEQTDRTDSPTVWNLLTFGCSATKGNCGKDAPPRRCRTLVEVEPRHRQYAQVARTSAPRPRFAAHAAFDLFTTLTNVNFNATRFMELIAAAVEVATRPRPPTRAAARAAGVEPKQSPAQRNFVPAAKISEVVEQAKAVGVDADLEKLGADIVGLRNLNLYGLRVSARTPTTPMRWATAPTRPTPASRTAWRSWGRDRPRRTRCWGTPRVGQRQLPGDGDARRRQHRQLLVTRCPPRSGHPGGRQGRPGLRSRSA